jgi:peptidoglycan/xylan/chitin deacetylase (PgdA/CDA1 family)
VVLPRIVTTSWDDGDSLDLRVAELLRSRGLAGTFYVPFRRHDGDPTLAPAQLSPLAPDGFEVGGHTLSHRTLTELNAKEIAEEVRVSKDRLEDAIGKRVRMFCYPKGQFNARVLSCVKEAGYSGARTNRMVRQGLDFDPFRMPTSLLVYPSNKSDYVRNLARDGNIPRLFDYLTQYIRLDSWVSLGELLFDRMLREGGVWHLYGHSWQIEELGLWDELKEMLDYVSGREGVRYVTNAEVLDFLPQKAIAALKDPHSAELR